AVERGADRERRDVAGEKRVTVRHRLGRDLGADVSARPAPVVDDDLLPQHVAQPGGYDAGDDVGRAARGEGYDVAQWPVGISLRRRPHRRLVNSDREQYKNNSKANAFHRRLLLER